MKVINVCTKTNHNNKAVPKKKHSELLFGFLLDEIRCSSNCLTRALGCRHTAGCQALYIQRENTLNVADKSEMTMFWLKCSLGLIINSTLFYSQETQFGR